MFIKKQFKNKKGIFFSVMTLSIILLLILNYKISFNKKQNIYSSNRADTMNKFIEDMIKDMKRSLYISSYRSLLSINQYILNNNKFIPNVEDVLSESIINGTIFGETNKFTERDNLKDWAEAIYIISDDFNINTEIKFLSMNITQISPWNIEFSVKAQFKVQEKNNYENDLNKILFFFNETVKTKLSIINFDDPVYSVYSLGTYINKINKSDYSDKDINTEVINKIITTKQYYTSTHAPDYLDRLKGNLNENKYGIISFVNQNELSSSYLFNRSDIDFLYWSVKQNAYKVENISEPWFRLDDYFINLYNLTKIN